MEMNISYDLGGLAVFDSSSVNFKNKEELEINSELKIICQENFVKLFRKYLGIKEKSQNDNEDQADELQLHDFDKSEFQIKL